MIFYKDERDAAQAYPVPLATENGVNIDIPFPVPLLFGYPVHFAFLLDDCEVSLIKINLSSLAASR